MNRLTRVQWLALGLLVVGSAVFGSIVTRAAGIPAGITDTPSTPVMVYSGVLLNDGVPVTTATPIEVALWDDPLPGGTEVGQAFPDKLLCETSEATQVIPDATGAFFVPLPDLVGVAEQDCRKSIAETRNVWIQVKINGVKVKFTDANGGQTLERLALANVPFAIEAGRASAAALPSQLENRIAALEALVSSPDAGFPLTIPSPGPEVQLIVDAGP